MKTTIKLLALAFVLFAAACSNDDEINMFNSLWRNVTQNEARIGNLEEWCAQANTNITSLQTIVNVIESNDAITSITPVMEGGVEVGYTITFADHDPITIYHGKDGKDGQNGADGQDGTSPIVGVAKHTDGVYYWTLNGEWLLDENGNKLRVSGEDGKDGTNGQNGITPQLKIKNDYWYVSYDNGNTWTRLGKAKGEDGADGQDGATGAKGDKGDTGAQGEKGDKGDAGDSMFRSVTQDADNVYFTLADGTVIIIAKGSGSSGDGTPDPGEGEGGSSDDSSSNLVPAAFSVSADKQVYFSPGNLQYIQSSDTWQFASCQWECVGTDNVTGGEDISDKNYYGRRGTALADKVDLFGWSTSATNFGVSTSKDYYDYSGSFVDWGSNQIGDDVPNTWRTLTEDEWNYLLEERTNASSLIGIAEVNGVNGLILLPDGWSCPDGVTFRSGFHDSDGIVDYYAAYQTITAAEWSKMKVAGAVFLPAAGYRAGSDVAYVKFCGHYWSASGYDGDDAHYLFFNCGKAYTNYYYRYWGRSVRLVKDL